MRMPERLPRRLLLVALAIAAGSCGRGNEQAANGAVPAAPAEPVQTATLTGLYESGEGPRRNQMCVIEREGQRTRFGIVTWGRGDYNCSGSGTATREGDRLRLAMDGSEACVIEARLSGRQVSLPASLPQGCAYYCGPESALAGTSFDKVGGEEADARRAVDLVGDPLCG